MSETAKLRAGDLVFPRPGGLEPRGDLTAGQDVLLQAEDGDEEAVDDVLGPHGDPDDLSDRHVELVFDLEVVLRAEPPVRPRVDEIPVELFRLEPDEDLRPWLRPLDLFPHLRPAEVDPQVHHQDDRRRDEDPGRLFPGVARNISGAAAFPATVADQKIDQDPEDQNEPGPDDVINQVENGVDIVRVRGCALGQPPQKIPRPPAGAKPVYRSATMGG